MNAFVIQKITMPPKPYKLILEKQLTHRELICLYWAARGKTTKETAILLRVKPRLVEQYRKAVRNKFGCKRLAEAVYIGMKRGYLSAFK